MNAEAWIKKYEDHLLMVKNNSLNTARGYVTAARQFLQDGLGGAEDWKAATREAAMEYVKLLKGHNKDVTVASKVYGLKGFFRFLKREGVVTENPFEEMEFKRLNRALPQFLSVDEMNQLLNRIREPVAALIGLHQEDVMLTIRDRAMLEVLYSAGLRVSELVGLDWGDINLRAREVRVLGKGNKQRLCPFGQPAINALVEHAKYYEEYYNTKPEGPRPVFISIMTVINNLTLAASKNNLYA